MLLDLRLSAMESPMSRRLETFMRINSFEINFRLCAGIVAHETQLCSAASESNPVGRKPGGWSNSSHLVGVAEMSIG